MISLILPLVVHNVELTVLGMIVAPVLYEVVTMSTITPSMAEFATVFMTTTVTIPPMFIAQVFTRDYLLHSD